MGSFFLNVGGSGGTVDWSNIQNKPALVPEAISTTLSFTDSSPKVIGIASKDAVVAEVVVEINSAFDSGIIISVGDMSDNTRLIDGSFIDPTSLVKYTKDVSYQYSVDTFIYIFATGAMTQGSCTVRVYFQ